MPALLLPNEILSLSAQAATRLLDAGDGDCALLYLALIREAGDGERARSALRWDEPRYSAAAGRLAGMELIDPGQAPVAEETRRRLEQPAEYSQRDLNTVLESEESFRGLADAVEDCLGRTLTTSDLRALLMLYDELALPAEVILTLAQWCVTETERAQGRGHRPRMSAIKKEALRWKKAGIVTADGAEEFLRRQEGVDRRQGELLALLDIRDRTVAVGEERKYLAAWIEMGFADDAVRLAYERTVFQKQKLNWAYMNSILKRWHQAGWHTADQAEAEDKPPAKADAPKFRRVNAAQPDYRPTAERIQKNADWLDEFLKSQEEGG